MDEDKPDVEQGYLEGLTPEGRQNYVKHLKLIKRRSGVNVGEVEEHPQDAAQALTPIQLLKAIQEGTVDPKRLTARQRLGCVAELCHKGWRMIEIAELFGISRQRAYQDRSKVLKLLAIEVRDFDPQQFVGWFLDQAEFHLATAKRAGKLDLSWKITLDVAGQLTQWGMVVPADQLRAQMDARSEKIINNPMEQLSDDELQTIRQIASNHKEEKVG
jgi:hypothetical protein